VVGGRFAKTLVGQGRVFGIKFWPGGFYPFFNRPVSTLTNQVIPLSDVVGNKGLAFKNDAFFVDDNEQHIAQAEKLLLSCDPSQDQNVTDIRYIVEQIASRQNITKVDHLVDKLDISKRTLQRLFNRYVGASPKWVIQRYRMHEALAKIDRVQSVDWAKMAIELGYFDQAHFIKHFKSLVGKSPDEYARSFEGH